MGLFEFIGDDMAAVTGGQPPGCGPCKRERDTVVEMRAEQRRLPGRVLDIWRCPECGTEVVRGSAGNEATFDGERF